MAPKNPSTSEGQKPTGIKKTTASSKSSAGVKKTTRSSKAAKFSASKTRRAKEVPEATPEAHKKRSAPVSYLADIFSPSAERTKERMAEEEALKHRVEPPKPVNNKPPLSAAEESMLQSKYIDERAAEYHAAEAEVAVHKIEQLEWNPDIMPNDPAYVRWKIKLAEQLQTRSVQSVLAENFSKAQIWTLQPSVDNGSTLKVQEEAAKEYKALLSFGGRFYGQEDNLITKLVLLKFGFPVAPLADTNVSNASNNGPNEDDVSNGPLEKSRYEKDGYSEKPLGFLDVYQEKSYGCPILRPEVKNDYVPSLRGGAGSTLDLEDPANPRPIYPDPSKAITGLRGGARPTPQAYLYSIAGGRLEAPRGTFKTPEEFRDCALQLLKIDPDSEWSFFMDIYTNKEDDKSNDLKPLVKNWTTKAVIPANLKERFKIDVKSRINNDRSAWVVVVRPADPAINEAVEFRLPEKSSILPTPESPALPRSLKKGKMTSPRKVDFENPASQKSPVIQPLQQSPKRQNQTIAPRLNKERTIKQRVAPLKIRKYNPWLVEQRGQDKLQRVSWRKDHPAILPGQKSEPILYGMTRELMLGNTDTFPTIYGQRLTPTDFHEILDQNQRLRLKVLERLEVCPLCDETFEKYDAQEAKEHFKAHMRATESAGVCPVCGTQQWLIMDMEQRRGHLEHHHSQEASGRDISFFETVHCPVCDKKLSQIGNIEDILFHMADHAPGVLRYCDHCGLHIKACDISELQHHERVCVDATDKPASEEEHIYCEDCGRDRTFETKEGLVAHRRQCYAGKGEFCHQCGFDMTDIGEENQSRHRGHCMPPRGTKKKFCQKCGDNLESKGKFAKSFHKKYCFEYEPERRIELDRQRNRQEVVQGEGDVIAQNTSQEAENQAALIAIESKMKDLKEQEERMKLQYAHNVGVCPMDKCDVVLTGFSPEKIIDHMKIHMVNLACPLEHEDGEVMCVHTEKGVKTTAQQSKVFKTWREHCDKHKKESENAAAASKKRKSEDVGAETINTPDEDENETSSSTSGSSSTSSSSEDSSAVVAPSPGPANKRRKPVGWKGGRISDPNYLYQPLADIQIPENELEPDHLSPVSPSKLPAGPSLVATDRVTIHIDHPGTQASKAKGVGRSPGRPPKAKAAAKVTPTAAKKRLVSESSLTVTDKEEESEPTRSNAKGGLLYGGPARHTRSSTRSTPTLEVVKAPVKNGTKRKAKKGDS